MLKYVVVVFFLDFEILCKTNSLTLANPPLPSPNQKENYFIFSDLDSFEKKNHLP